VVFDHANIRITPYQVAIAKCKLTKELTMVNITVVELHIEEGSLSANLPFGGVDKSEREDATDEDEDADTPMADDSTASNRRNGLALLGVLGFLVIATAAVKYLSGEGQQPDTSTETADEPHSVSTE
jgi:hypothetical protein